MEKNEKRKGKGALRWLAVLIAVFVAAATVFVVSPSESRAAESQGPQISTIAYGNNRQGEIHVGTNEPVLMMDMVNITGLELGKSYSLTSYLYSGDEKIDEKTEAFETTDSSHATDMNFDLVVPEKDGQSYSFVTKLEDKATGETWWHNDERKDGAENITVYLNPGNLEISKAVTQDSDAGAPDDEFNFQVTGLGNGVYDYTIDGDNGVYTISDGGIITLKVGQKATIKDIPGGMGGKITEVNIPANWQAKDDLVEKGWSIRSYETEQIEFKNKYTGPYGDLEISKSITPDNAPADQAFTFAVNGLGNGVYDYTISGDNGAYTIRDGGTISLKGGQTATIKNILKDSSVTVKETDVPEDWENYGDEEVTCIIEAKKTAKAEFGNKYIRPYGNLEISKNISPEYAPEQEFEFTVSGLGNGVYDYTVSGDNGIYTIRDGGTIKLTGGKIATITDIPKDSVVTVTETNIPKDWALMSDEQVSCTIIPEDTVKAGFENKYTSPHGSLEISKTITPDNIPADQGFAFEVSGLGNGVYKYTITGDNTAYTIRDGGTVVLKGGQTATITGIPAGTEVTVEEISQLEFWDITGDEEITVTIVDGETAKAPFENEYLDPPVIVGTKASVNGKGNETSIDKGKMISVTDEVTFENIRDDHEYWLLGILWTRIDGELQPIGFDFKENLVASDSPYTLDFGDETEVTEDGQKFFVEIGVYDITTEVLISHNSNHDDPLEEVTVSFNPGNLEISKTVSSEEEAPPDQEFEFTVSGLGNGVYDYTITGDNEIYTIRDGGIVKLKGGQTATVKDLPAGMEVKVTEADVSKHWENTGQKEQTCTIESSKTAEASFKNKYTTPPATMYLQLTKVIEKAPFGYEYPEFEFKLEQIPGQEHQAEIDSEVHCIDPASPDNELLIPFYIQFREAGEYTFKLSEVNKEGKEGFENILFNAEDKEITVTVERNTETYAYEITNVTGTEAEGEIYNAGAFKNNYVEPVDFTLTAEKVYKNLSGDPLDIGNDDFFLAYLKDENDELIDYKIFPEAEGGSSNVEFNKITYELSDITDEKGTVFTYYMDELDIDAFDGTNITYDNNTYTAKVTVSLDRENGVLNIDSVEYSDQNGNKLDNIKFFNIKNDVTALVSKKWINADGTTDWPKGVDAVLFMVSYGNDYEIVKLTADEPSKKSKGFPVLPDGRFRVEEVAMVANGEEVSAAEIKKYTAGKTEGDAETGFTITNTEETTDVTVNKIWSGDSFTVRPDKLTVYLMGDKLPVDQFTMTPNEGGEENFWHHTFNNLAKYSTLVKEILYEVDEETVPGYIKKIEGNSIINEFDEYGIGVYKVWKDINGDIMQPPAGSSATFTLRAFSEQGLELNVYDLGADRKEKMMNFGENGDSFVFWLGLRKVTKEGDKITYTVEETGFETSGYFVKGDMEIAVDEENARIYQANNLEMVNIPVKKVWVGPVPDGSVRVSLFANGEPATHRNGDPVEPLELNADGGWEGLFMDLLNEKGVEYTVKEDFESPYYSTDISKLLPNGFTITNTNIETVAVNGIKMWASADGDKPEEAPEGASVTLKLSASADGKEIPLDEGVEESKTINEFTDGIGQTSWSELRKYTDDGKEIDYTVTEEAFSGAGFRQGTVNKQRIDLFGGTVFYNLLINEKRDMTTEATDSATNDHIALADNYVSVKDVVECKNLEGFARYTLVSKLVKKSDGSVVTTKTQPFMTDDTGNITQTVEFDPIDATALGGEDLVALEYVYMGDYAEENDGKSELILIKHDDLEDAAQTVHLPAMRTNAYDKDDGDKVIEPGRVTIVDTVTYENLIPGRKYVITGNLVDKKTGKFIEAPGAKTSETFTPLMSHGTIELNYMLDASELDGKTIVVYEDIICAGERVAVHEDIEDVAQTIKVEKGHQQVSFSKLDENGNEIGGATLRVVDKMSGNTVASWETEEGQPHIELLPVGHYYLDEVVCPDGYMLADDVSFVVVRGAAHTIKYVYMTDKKIPLTDISGTITWDDENNRDGKRPDMVEVKLLCNGQEYTTSKVTPDEEGNWTYSFTDLEECNPEGMKYNYTVVETAIDGYTTTYGENEIINKYTPETTSVTVTKVWDDNSDEAGLRPDSIKVGLRAAGGNAGSAEITADDDWTYTFTDLPKYEGGVEISYNVIEDSVQGYTSSVKAVEGSNVFVITNTVEKPAETTDVTVEVKWNDDDDKAGLRPDSIKVGLRAEGGNAGTAEITAADGWTYTFKDLPKYEGDEEISYTIIPTEPEGYTMAVENVEGTNTFIVTAELEKFDYVNTKGDESTWTQGSTDPLSFTFVRTLADETAFSHFTGIEVDGKEVPEKDEDGNVNYTAVSGSVVVDLQATYLATLAEGRHTITAVFDDGSASADFTILAEGDTPVVPVGPVDPVDPVGPVNPVNPVNPGDNSGGSSSGGSSSGGSSGSGSKVVPSTGDNSNMTLWIAAAAACAAAIAGISIAVKRRRSND